MNIGTSNITETKNQEELRSAGSSNAPISKTEKVADSLFGSGFSAARVSIERSSFPPAVEEYPSINPVLDKDAACLFEADGNTFLFSPAKDCWEIKLDSLQSYYARIFIGSAIVFLGELDKEKFLLAFSRTLAHFHILFGRFKKNEETNEITVSYSKERKDFVSLEIIESSMMEEECDIDDFIPARSVEQMTMRYSEKHPVGSFRVNRFKGGFAIGYCLNHAFFDQSSICYFMKFLAHMYTHGTAIESPILFSANGFFDEPAIAFQKKEQLRSFNELEIIYSPDKVQFLERFTNPTQETVILRVSEEQLDKLAKQSPSFITANDLIHAIFFKVKAREFSCKGIEELKLSYACNLRKKLGLGEHTLGNILVTGCLKLSLTEIEKASIIELARINRENHSKMELKTFNKLLCWHDGLQNFKENLDDYLFSSCLEANSYLITNWSSFDYNEIQFGDATPTAIRAPYPKKMNAIPVHFEVAAGKKYYLLPIEIGIEQSENIEKLSQETGLFELNFEQS